ncbi:protein kinase [Streptomyces netropsis]|uniref:Serine/threonine protein kinase n=1 Tax=Streptomyces netropsis TaxID=55404 RepID=A0A7W7LBC9_STRNE|nr:protein kinase [Streptomyces netropsis]MBB4886897.1 serine/threonine protein kinase [Streptomyces netropsis]GGR23984.1 hypothetical protein GCM10010219_30930 [Streptomyces netropsis]
MDEYAGRVLADRYRLPLPPSDAFELVETRAFDTYSGQEVLIRQIPLPEIVDAEVVGDEGPYEGGRAVGYGAGDGHGPEDGPASEGGRRREGGHRPGAGHGEGLGSGGLTGQGPGDPAVRRALVAATAAAQLPDHPRLDQVFHVFVEAGSLWIISELVSARPLAALLAERTLSPHRAAEVAADVLTALRALHALGWTHRNITTRTVLICDDGRAVLTGLAAGAAEEALCGHDPVPVGPGGAEKGTDGGSTGQAAPRPGAATGGRGAIATPPAGDAPAGFSYPRLPDQRPPWQGPAGGGAARATGEAGTAGIPAQAGPVYRDQGAIGGYAPSGGEAPGTDRAGGHERDGAPDDRAPRAGAIAAYRAGARAAAARAAAESTPRPSTGSSTWGDGSPVGGAAESTDSPWGSDALVGRHSPSGSPGSGGLGGPGAPVPPQNGAGRRDGTDSAAAGWAYPAGPGGALAAERARQARMVVVGAVTERWAPEQAHPVQDSWQLAPPVGPAADLWALGVLLFRAVQGHAPYPEESAAELVQLVCAEPPAYAEECGALRPVVESLMRKDPTERPECEELRGWLRSLIRSAPEPDLGSRTVTVPSIGASLPTDPRRLPLIRRRGELVRRRRGRASGALDPATPVHGRHKKTAGEPLGEEPGEWDEAAVGGAPARDRGDDLAASQDTAPSTGRTRERRRGGQRSPRHLGRLLLGLILLLLVGAVLYALLFMPRADESTDRGQTDRTGTAGLRSAVPDHPGTNGRTGTQEARTAEPHGVAKGYTLRQDPKGFSVAVAEDWQRRGENDRDQVSYVGGDYELIVVPGRDKVSEFGGDPLAYQQGKEPELEPYRSSSWSGASGLRRNDVGGRARAEGTFNWNDSSGRQVYVRNAALILAGRYHVVQVIGPMDGQRSVDGFFDQATSTYRFTG